ncbi:MAG: hypothetical protein QM279_03355 [Atribacterota bacterium]|nr:hypothetical protein [Atribacterota bacterium]
MRKNSLSKSHCEGPNRSLVGRPGNLIRPLSHSEERLGRRENLINPPRHCEESDRSLVGRPGNLIRLLSHSEERLVRRENLIYPFCYSE